MAKSRQRRSNLMEGMMGGPPTPDEVARATTPVAEPVAPTADNRDIEMKISNAKIMLADDNRSRDPIGALAQLERVIADGDSEQQTEAMQLFLKHRTEIARKTEEPKNKTNGWQDVFEKVAKKVDAKQQSAAVEPAPEAIPPAVTESAPAPEPEVPAATPPAAPPVIPALAEKKPRSTTKAEEPPQNAMEVALANAGKLNEKSKKIKVSDEERERARQATELAAREDAPLDTETLDKGSMDEMRALLANGKVGKDNANPTSGPTSLKNIYGDREVPANKIAMLAKLEGIKNQKVREEKISSYLKIVDAEEAKKSKQRGKSKEKAESTAKPRRERQEKRSGPRNVYETRLVDLENALHAQYPDGAPPEVLERYNTLTQSQLKNISKRDAAEMGKTSAEVEAFLTELSPPATEQSAEVKLPQVRQPRMRHQLFSPQNSPERNYDEGGLPAVRPDAKGYSGEPEIGREPELSRKPFTGHVSTMEFAPDASGFAQVETDQTKMANVEQQPELIARPPRVRPIIVPVDEGPFVQVETKSASTQTESDTSKDIVLPGAGEPGPKTEEPEPAVWRKNRERAIPTLTDVVENFKPSGEATPAEERGKLSGLVEKLTKMTGATGESVSEKFKSAKEFLTSRDASWTEKAKTLSKGAGENLVKTGEWYRKLPLKYKIGLSAALIGTTVLTGGASTLVTIMTSAAMVGQRSLNALATYVLVEGLVEKGYSKIEEGKQGKRPPRRTFLKHALSGTSAVAAFLGIPGYLAKEAFDAAGGGHALETLAGMMWHHAASPEVLPGSAPASAPAVAVPEVAQPAAAAAAPAPSAEMPSVEAKAGDGYERMLKNLWEQTKGTTYPEGSNMARLQGVDPKDLNAEIHRLATDNEFFKANGESIQINIGDKLAVDANGDLWLNDQTILAPEGAPTTPALHPEAPTAVPDVSMRVEPNPDFPHEVTRVDTNDMSGNVPVTNESAVPAPEAPVQAEVPAADSAAAAAAPAESATPPPAAEVGPNGYLSTNGTPINPDVTRAYLSADRVYLFGGDVPDSQAQEYAMKNHVSVFVDKSYKLLGLINVSRVVEFVPAESGPPVMVIHNGPSLIPDPKTFTKRF